MTDATDPTLLLLAFMSFAGAVGFFLAQVKAHYETLVEAAGYFNRHPDTPEAKWFFRKHPDLRAGPPREG
jgi:hypothetical protein